MPDITAPLDALLRAGFVSTSVNGAELTERDIRALIDKHREDAATIAALREVVDAAEAVSIAWNRIWSPTVVGGRAHAETQQALSAALANLKGAHHAD